jgi:hypothetical protein
MSIVQRRILEQLGTAGLLLATGCRDPEVAQPVPSSTIDVGGPAVTATSPEASPTATATPTATGTTDVVATSTSTSTATPPPPGTGEVGATCSSATDCRKGLHCQLGFDGAEFSKTGQCVVHPPIYRGRPLVVGGEPRVARVEVARHALDVDGWASYFARAAAEEHASVAAFARTICQLMALGAPLELLERTQAALADELDHTRGSLAWFQRFSGGEASPGALVEAIAPLHGAEVGTARDLDHALLVDVLRGGCFGETLAAEAMLERAEGAEDLELGAWLRRVADDEARHAALAFETAAWLVRRRPELADVVAAELAQLDAQAARLVAPLFEATGLVGRVAA